MQPPTQDKEYPIVLGHTITNQESDTNFYSCNFKWVPKHVDTQHPQSVSQGNDKTVHITFGDDKGQNVSVQGQANETTMDYVLLFDGQKLVLERASNINDVQVVDSKLKSNKPSSLISGSKPTNISKPSTGGLPPPPGAPIDDGSSSSSSSSDSED